MERPCTAVAWLCMSMLKVGGDYEQGCRVEHALTMCSRLNTGKSIGVGHKIYGADHWRVAKLKSDTAVLLLEAGNSGEEALRLLQEAHRVLAPLHKPDGPAPPNGHAHEQPAQHADSHIADALRTTLENLIVCHRDSNRSHLVTPCPLLVCSCLFLGVCVCFRARACISFVRAHAPTRLEPGAGAATPVRAACLAREAGRRWGGGAEYRCHLGQTGAATPPPPARRRLLWCGWLLAHPEAGRS